MRRNTSVEFLVSSRRLSGQDEALRQTGADPPPCALYGKGLLSRQLVGLQMQDKELWRELCEQAAAEQDSARLLVLVREINLLLDEKWNRLARREFPILEEEPEKQ